MCMCVRACIHMCVCVCMRISRVLIKVKKRGRVRERAVVCALGLAAIATQQSFYKIFDHFLVCFESSV